MPNTTLTSYSTNDGPGHHFKVVNEAGSQVGADITATHAGSGTHRYSAGVPGSLAAGYYTFSVHRTSNERLRAQGEFYWDGSEIVRPEAQALTSAQVETATGAALTAYDAATGADITAGLGALNDVSTVELAAALTDYDAATGAELLVTQAAIIAAIAALNNVSAAQVEAALFDDADGTAFRAGLAQVFESHLANDADAHPTLALIQGAAQAAITASSLATSSGLTTAETNIIAALPTPSDATVAKQNQIIADIAALNNISAADVLSQSGDALTAYDPATTTELGNAVTSIVNAIASGQGLTTAQATILTFLRDVAEADEEYTPTKARKLLKGTATVLVDKDVTSSTTCDVNTTLIEAA